MSMRVQKYIWNPAKCACENGMYLGSIIANSVHVMKL